MKRLLFFAAVLLCAACDHEETLPVWNRDMPLENIESYLSSQSADRIDFARVADCLTGSQVECGMCFKSKTRYFFVPAQRMKFYFAPDGRCVWTWTGQTKKGDDQVLRLSDYNTPEALQRIEQRLGKEAFEWPVGTWRIDPAQRKILLYDLAGEMLLADWTIGYLSENRMIAAMAYHDLDCFVESADELKWPKNFYVYFSSFDHVAARYLVGECTPMTIDEFKQRYELE